MTTDPPPIKRLTPLDMQGPFDIVLSLRYQLAGDAATFQEAPCGDGHLSRQGLHCAACIDAEMHRRGVDVATGKHKYGEQSAAMFIRIKDGTLRNAGHETVRLGYVRQPAENKS